MSKRPIVAEQDRELLSAYLDNNLSTGERARVETRLAAEPALRAELAALRQTVQALRAMPAVRAPRNFTLNPARFQRQPSRLALIFPALRLASAFATMLFVVLLAGQAMRAGVVPSAYYAPAAGQTSSQNAPESSGEPMRQTSATDTAYMPPPIDTQRAGPVDGTIVPPAPSQAQPTQAADADASPTGAAGGGSPGNGSPEEQAPYPPLPFPETALLTSTQMMSDTLPSPDEKTTSLPYGNESADQMQVDTTGSPDPLAVATGWLTYGVGVLALVLVSITWLAWRQR